MNARDLARLGLLYLNNGVWNGEPILSEEWIDFVRTPAPSTSNRGNYYGGQWWLVPEDRKSTRLNSSHIVTSYAVFCLKKKTTILHLHQTTN